MRFRNLRWKAKQRLAKPGRYYGDGGTIHHTTGLDVEVRNGQVFAVWFRCQPLPFNVTNVTAGRAEAMDAMYDTPNFPEILGVELLDLPPDEQPW